MADAEVAVILRRARVRIQDPDRWTRGAYARDAHGEVVGDVEDGGDPFDKAAACWCASGAISLEAGADRPELAHAAIGFLDAAATEDDRFIPLLGVGTVVALNDGAELLPEDQPLPAPDRHRMVLAVFDRAIELAEAA